MKALLYIMWERHNAPTQTQVHLRPLITQNLHRPPLPSSLSLSPLSATQRDILHEEEEEEEEDR